MVSQQWTELSSEPESTMRPERDRPQQVKAELGVGGAYSQSCWSALRSNSRVVLSSEQEQNPCPEGWNCRTRQQRVRVRPLTDR